MIKPNARCKENRRQTNHRGDESAGHLMPQGYLLEEPKDCQ